MKKKLFILCTALCFPFISCSNDDAMDDILTRAEQIENDYNKSLNHACAVLMDNGFPSENIFNAGLLAGTWKRTDVTAEIYVDGEKVNDTWCFDSKENEGFQHSLVCPDDLDMINLNNDRTFVLQNEGGVLQNLTGWKWDYLYNHIIAIFCGTTIKEIVDDYRRLFPTKLFTEETTFLHTYYYEVLELTENKLVIKTETLEHPVMDGLFYEKFYDNKSGTHCFIIETLERQ